MMKNIPRSLIVILIQVAFLTCSPALALAAGQTVRQAAVASAHPLATSAGIQILKSGGNAFDAAVAVSAALAVVEPYSSGIGGGGFWLLHRAADNHQVMVDGRERAPLAAHRDMYLDKQGNVVASASIDGSLAAGIPGEIAALEHITGSYGNLSLGQNLNAAIGLAQHGFPVDEYYRRLAGFRLEVLRASADAAAIFLRDNEVPKAGELIRQPDLAKTLARIAREGAKAFYSGDLAVKMVDFVRKSGGLWRLEDLSAYKIIERPPVRFDFGGDKNAPAMKVTSVPPPSSGGVALSQMFAMLDELHVGDKNNVQRIHAIIEAMRRAYRDRAEYLGDSDYVDVPLDKLLSRKHVSRLLSNFNKDSATPSASLKGIAVQEGANDTTHFSIVDFDGNRVAATLSINYPFGSGYVIPGTGILLNDEMDDFSAKPGVPNAYGLVGGEANAIESGKRMLSSMSPTFLETSDRIAVIGTPGGSRIITMVLLAALDFHRGADVQHIVNLPRFHHQYLPDRVFVEPNGLAADDASKLRLMGHDVVFGDSTWGNMHTVIIDRKSGQLTAASDARGAGKAQVITQ